VPPKPLPLLALLADFQRACAGLNVGWYLFGAQAALLYGSPRLTADADLTLIRKTLADLSEALAQDDLLPLFERLFEAVTQGRDLG